MRTVTVSSFVILRFISMFFLSCEANDLTSTIVLSNNHIRVAFLNTTGFPLQWLGNPSQKDSNLVVTSKATASVPLWSLILVGENGMVNISSLDSNSKQDFKFVGNSNLILHWHSFPSAILSGIEVFLNVTLSSSSGLSLLRISVTRPNAMNTPLALWSISINIPGLSAAHDDVLFYPRGYGIEFPNPCITTKVKTWPKPSTQATSPSQGATMQFMALGGGENTGNIAAYVAAHDPEGMTKKVRADFFDGWATLGFDMVVDNAGVDDLGTYTMPFDIAVGVLPGSDKKTPIWFSAARLYRTWALNFTRWALRGTISDRKDRYPEWFKKNNLWFNTGWQCYPRFNDTQGEPGVVLSRALAIRERFNTSFALHWYEWQHGPTEQRYIFNTHYPDYFPPRNGFRDVVANLTAEDIQVFPYINGLIFDVDSDSYRKESGSQSVVAIAKQIFGADKLSLTPIHKYAPSNASFRNACVSTEYWRDKISTLAKSLVTDWGVPGVYIDQISSHAPGNDWGRLHNHSNMLGGGSWWWAEGLDKMLANIHTTTVTKSTPIIAEGNAETAIGVLEGSLTLWAYDAPIGQSIPSTHRRFVPAFPAVYGGYFIGIGGIFNHFDVATEPDIAAARIAGMFVAGTQLGWFSLGGINHGQYKDRKCGRMDTFDAWMDPQQDSLVNFISMLVTARTHVANTYFVHGHVAMPAYLQPQPSYFQSNASISRNPGPYSSIISSVWQSGQLPNTICVFLVGVRQTIDPTNISLQLNMTDYDFPVATKANFEAIKIQLDGSRHLLKRFQGDIVILESTILPRSVQMIEVSMIVQKN